MLTHDKRVVHSSLDPNWGTPREMYDGIERTFTPRGFILDAAADSTNHKCPLYLGPGGIHENALTFEDWEQFSGESVFMNPPWSRELKIRIDPFVIMAGMVSRAFNIRFVTVLPAAIQTQWWYLHVWHRAHNIFHIPHRVNFDASDAMLNHINAKRMKKGQDPIEETWNAAGNTSVVIFDGAKRRAAGKPDVDYWSYRANWESEIVNG